MNYLLHLTAMLGIYSLIAYSMNLVTGFGGLITFCQAAFYGAGAYAYALLTIGAVPGRLTEDLLFTQAWPFLPALTGAALAGAATAAATGWLCLRFRKDFFIFATIGCQMIVYVVLYNWNGLGRGAFGIYGIPRPILLGWEVRETWQYALLVAGANALVLPVLFAIYRSPFGLSLKSLRENERAAESLGVPARRQYLAAIVCSGVCAGLAGGLFASYVTYIDPTSFDLRESLFVMTILLLGGGGNVRGPLAGVLVMLLLPEALRFVGLPGRIAQNVREILYGAVLITLMYFRPQGLAGSHAVG